MSYRLFPRPVALPFVLLTGTLGCHGQSAKTAPRPAAHPAALHAAVGHPVPDAQYGVPFGTVMLPAGWAFNGGVLHASTCAVTGPSPVFAGSVAGWTVWRSRDAAAHVQLVQRA